MTAVPTSPAPTPRHALGLPAGSVRALLAFGVLALSWGIVLKQLYGGDPKLPLMFVYLQALMLLILASFFAAHGKSIGGHVDQRPPLGLPRGSVRFLLLAGYAGLVYFLYRNKSEFDVPPTGQEAWFVLLLVTSGFFLGHFLSRFIQTLSGGTEPYWYQDIQAWMSLLAMIAMTVVSIMHLVINPSLKQPDQLDLTTVEAFLSAVVGFYFGSRS